MEISDIRRELGLENLGPEDIDRIKLQLQTLNDTIQGGIRSANLKEYRNTYVINAQDSLDGDLPMYMHFNIIPEMTKIVSIQLSFWFLNFRAYAKGAASGGGATSGSGGGQTSSSGGGQTTSSGGSSTPTTSSGGGQTSSSVTTPSGGGSTSGATGSASGGGNTSGVTSHGHSHIITLNNGAGGTTVKYSAGNFYCDLGGAGSVYVGAETYDHTHSTPNHTHPNHTHSTPNHTHPAHSHTVANHTHTVNIANHTHTVANHTHTVANHTHSTPNHTHDITYGIFEEETSPTIMPYISRDNGLTYGLPLGSYSKDQENLDITRMIDTSGNKLIKFESNARTRISVQITIKLDISAR